MSIQIKNIIRSWLLAMLLACIHGQLWAADSVDGASEDRAWSGQMTLTNQWQDSFRAPYSGVNSLNPRAQNNETFDLTLALGQRVFERGELWLNAEIDQGFGISNTLGLAGYSSGEAYKVGANQAYLRLPKLFYRHTFSLTGAARDVDAGPNQLHIATTEENVVLTVGKFSVVDLFDVNSYAHDPRSDFMNWSLIDAGAFDYAADPWGLTYGLAVEWNRGPSTLRGGLFQMSPVPNSKFVRPSFAEREYVVEFEHRHLLTSMPGKIKLLAFVNHADMGSYADAMMRAQELATVPDTAVVRHTANQTGWSLNLEQQIAPDLGGFMRWSNNQGKYEAYEFSDIHRSFQVGLALKGQRWSRENDRLGVALAVNALSGEAQRYFAAGGLGILIGDGALNYAPEKVTELYYTAQIMQGWSVSADLQHIVNPAYNRDRGPVTLYALRLHADF